MKLSKFILPFLLFAFFRTDAYATSKYNARETVDVLATSDNTVTLAFTFRNWRFDTLDVDGEYYKRADFAHATFSERPGDPQIPYYVTVVGIPLGADVRYTIIETETEIVDDFKLLPFPEVGRVNDRPVAKFVTENSAVKQNDAFPRELIKIEKPGLFREQEIARIQLAGLQYFAADTRIAKYNRIVVRLEFVGGERKNTAPSLSAAEEAFYRAGIVNYEQSRNWRRQRQNAPRQLNSLSSFQSLGTMYKFMIEEEGIYKIDGRFLQSHNIDLNSIDPATIKLYNNGGRELTRALVSVAPDALTENAIAVDAGGDGRFDPDDFILFYGIGVNDWEYDASLQRHSHYVHHYTTENVYWLSFDEPGAGKRMSVVNSGAPTGQLVRQYQGRAFIEEELFNPVNSGLRFWGRRFDQESRQQSYSLTLPNAIAGGAAELRARFMALNLGTHTFRISVNNSLTDIKQVQGLPLEHGQFLQLSSPNLSPVSVSNLTPGANAIEIDYSHTSNFGQAFTDWIELVYPAQLNAIDDELAFTVFPDTGAVTFRIDAFSGEVPTLFDVTDFANVNRIAATDFANGSLTFTDMQDANQPKRYFALTEDRYKSVESLERVEFTDLRTATTGAEFIIISHEDFLSEAFRLESLRENLSQTNRLQTEVVRIGDVYNSFSGGLMDAVAIRDFIKYAYENWNPRPAYVLLLGDGDYDHKNIISRRDQNWIPTFQTDLLEAGTRLRELDTRTSDSQFTYISGNDFIMDIAIGRINAQTREEAAHAIDKIISYETQPEFGSWRNRITIVGDDELNSGGRPFSGDLLHIPQAENLGENFTPQTFDLRKIYLTEFPATISASVGGKTKPEAREALIDQINEGTLIVNYIGHGNSRQWAHEVVFQQSDNDRVQNQGKLTFFVAATCDWALYDDPQEQSQAEELLLAENRGAIAMLSSARLVFSTQNAAFNRGYYRQLFSEGGMGQTARIGDAFVLTRLTSTSTITNDEKFHIYGDPTLRLAIPQAQAVITSITPDSILALSTMEVTGEVQRDGQLWSDYNGTALLRTFDSKQFVRYITEVANSTLTYFLPGNSIYRGTIPVTNGKFSARFVVPKDISYGGDLARISTYFWNEDTDGIGVADSISVSSSSSNLVDSRGPQIKIAFRDFENFTTGDIINENATLVVELADTVSGINIAGEIGHRITLSIDPDQETCLSQFNRFNGITAIDLTDLFEFNEGDHLRGKIEFPLNFPREVEIGGQEVSCIGPDGEDRHTLVVKAWDNSNNSSTASVEVLIAHDQGLVVENVMNYPNPFSDKTAFTFISNQDVEVEIKIYTVSGQLIRTLEYPFAVRGFNKVEWDGRDQEGDIPANGVYLYKVIARSPGVEQKETIGRLAIIR